VQKKDFINKYLPINMVVSGSFDLDLDLMVKVSDKAKKAKSRSPNIGGSTVPVAYGP
jgi:hypothetical protein